MDRILSSAEHVKFCVNLPEPSGKAKYVVRPIANKYREGKVHNDPTSYSSLARIRASGPYPKRKQVLNRRLVSGGRRETL